MVTASLGILVHEISYDMVVSYFRSCIIQTKEIQTRRDENVYSCFVFNTRFNTSNTRNLILYKFNTSNTSHVMTEVMMR